MSAHSNHLIQLLSMLVIVKSGQVRHSAMDWHLSKHLRLFPVLIRRDPTIRRKQNKRQDIGPHPWGDLLSHCSASLVLLANLHYFISLLLPAMKAVSYIYICIPHPEDRRKKKAYTSPGVWHFCNTDSYHAVRGPVLPVSRC